MTREVENVLEPIRRALTTDEGTASLARDSQVGAVLNNPAQRAALSETLSRNGLLGQLTIDVLADNLSQINLDRDAFVTRAELQAHREYAIRSGNGLAVLATEQALRGMQQANRDRMTVAEIQRPYSNLQPEARRMREAAQEFPGIRTVMQSMDPRNVEGQTVSVGSLRAAITNNPERFTPAQLRAAQTLLDERNIGNLTSDNGYGRAILNWGYRGNDSRYLNPERIEQRATSLGAPHNPADDLARQSREQLARAYNAARGEILPNQSPSESPSVNPRDTGPRRPGTPRNYEPSSDSRYSEYTIRSGDTMWHVAREFMQRNNPNGEAPTNQQIDRMYRAIARENNIQNPNNVPVGTRLRIPREYQQVINPARQRTN